jgi:receptor protein-tyrosine kinase/non-specific protein-tyrosine kinase
MWYIDSQRTPQYSGYASVVIFPSPALTDSRTVVDLVGQLGARYVIGTYAQTFGKDAVKSAAQHEVGLSPEVADKYPLEANALPDTLVIEVSGQGPNRQLLSDYLDATVSEGILDSAPLFNVIELQQLELAHVSSTPTSPQPIRDVGLAVGLGIVVGLLLAFAINYLRS